ncbi:MAG: hypothetical protein OEZ28_15060 [Nitrospinota bacterium]|nr:hypothetical protein [Nitrospinota bacterium]
MERIGSFRIRHAEMDLSGFIPEVTAAYTIITGCKEQMEMMESED